MILFLEGIFLCFILLLMCVIGISNGPERYVVLIILYIMGIFDKGFIDGYWVQKTKAWVIEGTEDLMPYIPKKLYLKKWIGSIVANTVFSLIIALVMSKVL